MSHAVFHSEENENNNIEMMRNGSLIIHDASRVDSGIYRCIAATSFDKQVLEYVVTVIGTYILSN